MHFVADENSGISYQMSSVPYITLTLVHPLKREIEINSIFAYVAITGHISILETALREFVGQDINVLYTFLVLQ